MTHRRHSSYIFKRHLDSLALIVATLTSLVFPVSASESQTPFDQLDRNNAGAITFTEFSTVSIEEGYSQRETLLWFSRLANEEDVVTHRDIQIMRTNADVSGIYSDDAFILRQSTDGNTASDFSNTDNRERTPNEEAAGENETVFESDI